jgi:signal transduction histidine kinase
MIKLSRFCVMSLTVLSLGSTLGQGMVPVSEPPDIWPLLRVVSEDQTGMTPQEAWEKAQSGAAMIIRYPSQILAPANSPAHWAAWQITFDASHRLPWWLSLESPTLENATLWMRWDQGDWQRQPLLSETNSTGWGSGQLFFTWPIYDTSAQQLDFLVRTEGSNRVQFPLVIQTPHAFLKQHVKWCLVAVSILSLPVWMALYALTLLPVLRSSSLWLFVLITLVETFAATWLSGLMNILWPQITHSRAAILGCSAYGLLLGFGVYHAQAFVGSREHYPIMHRWLHAGAMTWWLVLISCFVWWAPDLKGVLLFAGTLHAFVLLGVSLYHHRQQPSMPNLMFVWVWVVYLLGMAVYVLFRYLEWPLIITLGTHFLQGAVVTLLLGWSACLRVLQEREQWRREADLSFWRHRWFAAAHHDLWQPMQSMLLYAKAVCSVGHPRLKGLVEGLQITSQAIEDCMTHLRFWSSEVAPQISDSSGIRCINIYQFLNPLVLEFRLLATQRHVTLRFATISQWVLINDQAVARMVRNLLLNALQSVPAGGRVLLGCRRQSNRIWIWCMDNGRGMTPAQLTACETALSGWQDSANPKPTDGTLGLGLFSFTQLARQMDLPSRMHSQLGKGTMIGFAVPMATNPSPG